MVKLDCFIGSLRLMYPLSKWRAVASSFLKCSFGGFTSILSMFSLIFLKPSFLARSTTQQERDVDYEDINWKGEPGADLNT
jgi:hypothetical protein